MDESFRKMRNWKNRGSVPIFLSPQKTVDISLRKDVELQYEFGETLAKVIISAGDFVKI